MIIYTYLDSAPLLSQGPWLRAWQRSWQRNGWQPRLLTRRIAEQHPKFYLNSPPEMMRWLALARQRERGYFSSIFIINQSFKPSDVPGHIYFPVNGPPLAMKIVSRDAHAYRFGEPGWQKGALVNFEGLPIEELYDSGVPL